MSDIFFVDIDGEVDPGPLKVSSPDIEFAASASFREKTKACSVFEFGRLVFTSAGSEVTISDDLNVLEFHLPREAVVLKPLGCQSVTKVILSPSCTLVMKDSGSEAQRLKLNTQGLVHFDKSVLILQMASFADYFGEHEATTEIMSPALHELCSAAFMTLGLPVRGSSGPWLMRDEKASASVKRSRDLVERSDEANPIVLPVHSGVWSSPRLLLEWNSEEMISLPSKELRRSVVKALPWKELPNASFPGGNYKDARVFRDASLRSGQLAEYFVWMQIRSVSPKYTSDCWLSSAKRIYLPNDNSVVDDTYGCDFVVNPQVVEALATSEVLTLKKNCRYLEVKATARGESIEISRNELAKAEAAKLEGNSYAIVVVGGVHSGIDQPHVKCVIEDILDRKSALVPTRYSLSLK